LGFEPFVHHEETMSLREDLELARLDGISLVVTFSYWDAKPARFAGGTFAGSYCFLVAVSST
jgi:hypothetical protein